MLFNVPQNINVEDKIAGPLTAKQLMWMFGMGATLLVLYVSIPAKSVFYAAAVPVAFIFCALAFYRPQGQPLINFVIAFFFFLFRPKIYIWKRSSEKKKAIPTSKIQTNIHEKERIVTPEEISGLAKVLDTRGEENNSAVMDYLASREKQKQIGQSKKGFPVFNFPSGGKK